MAGTATHTKTYVELTMWASTIPVDPPVPEHWRGPVVGERCCAPDSCEEELQSGEECYYVTELPRVAGREQPVCWRHIHPNTGPVVVR